MKTRVLAAALAVGVAAAACRHRAPEAAAPGPAISARFARALAGHTKQVWCVAFGPDGRELASGSVDGTVRLWRVADGATLRVLKHPEGVTSVDVSPDDQWVASSSYDKAVRIWRCADGALVRTLVGHTDAVWTVAFSPDGRWIASGGADRTVRIWRVADGALVRTIPAHDLIVWSVAFSPDSKLLASASFDHAVKIWRVEDGSLVRTLRGHTQAVVEAQFSPDGTLIASGSREQTTFGEAIKTVFGPRLAKKVGKTLRIWRVSDGALLQTMSDQPDDVHSVSFSPDGHWLASSGEDPRVFLWRVDGGAEAGPAH